MIILSTAIHAEENETQKTISETVQDKTPLLGFIDMYQDKTTGSLMMKINDTQLDNPFIYFSMVENGFLDSGHVVGMYNANKLIRFRKRFNKIDVISKANRYKFDKNSPLSRNKDANTTISVLASLSIEAEDSNGNYLVKADDLLLTEALTQLTFTPSPENKAAKKRFEMGTLSTNKTKYESIKNYPNNTNVSVEYVYENPMSQINPLAIFKGDEDIADPRNVVVKLQHSFVSLPNNDYKPRKDDFRVGYLAWQFDNQTNKNTLEYDDVITRWRLIKKDPLAPLSAPVKPITWWIENTTPYEYRDVIKNAVLAWNFAFEKAGFKNAIEVKIQPDDADWDAGDIRYNVLRWTSSPKPAFLGYGPSISNPETGEIIGADIMLEYSVFRNYGHYDDLFNSTNARNSQNTTSGNFCNASIFYRAEVGFAKTFLNSINTNFDLTELEEQALSWLVMHEVGHTLGLSHNMKGSQLHNVADLHNKNITKGVLSGSVMDYIPINISQVDEKQGDFTSANLGPYDLWAIEYGYSQELSDKSAEKERLEKILLRSTEHELSFGNDADDMRNPGVHIDPRVMIGDLSSDAVTYSIKQFELIKQTFTNLNKVFLEKSEVHHELLMSSDLLFRIYKRSAVVISRYIGGIHVNRARIGQPGVNEKPYEPVKTSVQKFAMETLGKYVFSESILNEAENSFAYLQIKRRGFSQYESNEDPKVHNKILDIQKSVLNHLLHKNVLMRISDSNRYGNNYSLNAMLEDLTDHIFDKNYNNEVGSYRQNLQIEYVERLIASLDKKSGYDHLSRAALNNQLSSLLTKLRKTKSKGTTRIHQKYLSQIIEQALNFSNRGDL